MDRRFGFIHDKLNIKLLILYILRRLPEPVSFDTLSELALCDDAISYFDYSECLTELRDSGQLKVENGLYAITDEGRKNVDTIGTSLPYCVRIRAQKSTTELAAKQKRDSLITTSHSARVRGGYTVSLSMDDGLGPVISMELLAGTEDEAAAIEKNFRENAEPLYGKIMMLLLEES